MSVYDGLPDTVTEVFGAEATAERAYDLLTVDVPIGAWISALEIARDKLACTYFDWLSAVDEPGTGFRVSAHVVSLEGRSVRRLLIRTTVPHAAPVLPTAVDVYAGAAWHERETHEMFGIDFTDHPHLAPLLLPDTFEGHPLRKDFVLAARVAKAWPGAKEPGESEHGGPKRRQMLPPGVPDPNEWGPLKGQLPAAPARPARGARAGAAGASTGAAARAGTGAARAGTAGAADRPARRSRSVSEGSASQVPPETSPGTTGSPAAPAVSETSAAPTAPARRSRSASQGSVSQAPPEAAAPGAPAPPATGPEASGASTARPPRRNRSAADGSASQAAAGTKPGAAASGTPAPDAPAPDAPGPDAPAPDAPAPDAPAPDAPWHHARPTFDEPEPVPPMESEPEAESRPAPSNEPDRPQGPDDPTHPAGGDTA
ncbi:NADH-quinone oxidoreductase subunit C [Streptomyces sp. NPDC021093]|uniref:NADH-quinone oxidoreductase subunit C n=1 Tax=Streptomyces sp. NPDC021093 TaxID=3365112 RepID=UPI00379D5157